MNKFEEINQTQFSFEEPLSSDINVDLPLVNQPIKPIAKNNKKKFMIIGVVAFVILIILLVIILKYKKKPIIEVTEVNKTEVTNVLGPLEMRIENARIDLEIADPSNQDLTFPPVDMKLRIDKKEK